MNDVLAHEGTSRETWHLNLRWSLAQIWKIEELARRGLVADDIAFELDTTSVEIKRVCERNGFLLRPSRHVPRLPVVSIRREATNE